MSDATVLRLGANNGDTDKRELFLKLFGGEVMTAFDINTVTEGRHKVRNITSGKSASFPATWKVTASYHTPGAEIVGQTSNISERVIHIDDLLIADVFIANIDEAMNHFEVRSEYSKQAGQALALRKDKNVLQVGVLAASASATVTGGNGGSVLTSTTTLYRTSATDLAAGIYAAVQAMDEKDIPESLTKNVFVRPAQYYLLAQSTALINRDWMGAGSYSDGKILRIGGAEIVKTNNLPITDLSATGVAGEKNTYVGDFSKVAALVMCEPAVGTVQLLGLQTEMGYDMRRQGTLLLAKYAVGHGILRPECAVALKTTA